MSHHRHNSVAPPQPMDPTHQNSTTKKPHPDPSFASSTVQNISNHFSKLYNNHKSLSIDTHFKAKPISVISDSSTASLTKSNSQRRPHTAEMGRRGNIYTNVKGKTNNYKSIREYSDKREIVSTTTKKERESDDTIKKGYVANQESDKLQEGHEMKRLSLSSIGMGKGGRRSFSSSQAELADFLACNGVKIVSVDMPPFMQIHAVDCARKTVDSLEKFTAKTLALTLKKEFDGVYGPAWHCIVGSSFGSFVTHSVGGFLYLSMDQNLYVLLFKTTVQRAQH